MRVTRHLKPIWTTLALPLLLTSCEAPLQPIHSSRTDPAIGSEAGAAPSPAPAGAEIVSRPAGSQGVLYPVAIGNRWEHERTFTVQITPFGQPPLPPEVTRTTYEVEQVCFLDLSGERYFVERTLLPDESPSYSYMRQSDGGLFTLISFGGPPPPPCDPSGAGTGIRRRPSVSADDRAALRDRALAAIADARRRAAYERAWERIASRRETMAALLGTRIGAAAGESHPHEGRLENELTLIEYPPHPGATWSAFDLFGLSVTGNLEAVDALPSPGRGRLPAFRVRYDASFFGPDDSFRVWYGRSGNLRQHLHVEGIATDEVGNPIGMLVSDQLDLVTGIQLVGPGSGRFADRSSPESQTVP